MNTFDIDILGEVFHFLDYNDMLSFIQTTKKYDGHIVNLKYDIINDIAKQMKIILSKHQETEKQQLYQVYYNRFMQFGKIPFSLNDNDFLIQIHTSLTGLLMVKDALKTINVHPLSLKCKWLNHIVQPVKAHVYQCVNYDTYLSLLNGSCDELKKINEVNISNIIAIIPYTIDEHTKHEKINESDYMISIISTIIEQKIYVSELENQTLNKFYKIIKDRYTNIQSKNYIVHILTQFLTLSMEEQNIVCGVANRFNNENLATNVYKLMMSLHVDITRVIT